MASNDVDRTTPELVDTNTRVSISMTRANKILMRLRENTERAPKVRSLYGATNPTTEYGYEIDLLVYERVNDEARLADIKEKFEAKRIKKVLTDKWKNRLFSLNLRYGLHDVLSEIDALKSERTDLLDVIGQHKSNKYITLEAAEVSMKAVDNVTGKYTFKWKISPFDVKSMATRVVEINKQIGKLDDKKDAINISNTFSIDVTPAELKLLELD
jgi:hypothetical protein